MLSLLVIMIAIGYPVPAGDVVAVFPAESGQGEVEFTVHQHDTQSFSKLLVVDLQPLQKYEVQMDETVIGEVVTSQAGIFFLTFDEPVMLDHYFTIQAVQVGALGRPVCIGTGG